MALLIASDSGLSELAGPLKRDGYSIEICFLKDVLSAAMGAVEAVLLDSGFDAEKGIELLKALKTKRPGLPVIFFTNKSSEETVASAFRSGARDYFKKPVNIGALNETLYQVIRIRETGQRERRTPFFVRQGIAPSTLKDTESRIPSYVRRAVDHLERNFSGDIRLEGLAGEAGISKHYLCRAFKLYTGFSPMRFLARLRMERAKELLKEGSLSVSMIAAEVGFNDLGSFIKQFKRLTGHTPGEFRKNKPDMESLRLF